MSTLGTTRTLQTFEGKATLTREEAARFVNVNGSTLQRLTDRGIIKSIPVGSNRRWRVSDLVAYIDSLG